MRRIVSPRPDYDFANHTFRCHDSGKLLNKKGYKDSYLVKIYEEIVNGIDMVIPWQMEKGLKLEDKSIDLFCELKGIKISKNKRRYHHELFSGEPDLVNNKSKWCVDIKTTATSESFESVTKSKGWTRYRWQLTCYAALTGYKKQCLAFCSLELRKVKVFRYEIEEKDIEHVITQFGLAKQALINYAIEKRGY